MNKIITLIEKITEKTGKAISWISLLLVLVVCYDVLTRYLLQDSSVAVQETEWHLFSLLFLLSAAFTLKYDKHVRVDVFYQKFSAKRKAFIDLAGILIFLIPFCILVIWSSSGFVSMSYKLGEISPDPGGLPFRFLLKASIPLGFFLLLLQGVAMALKSIMMIKSAAENQ